MEQALKIVELMYEHYVLTAVFLLCIAQCRLIVVNTANVDKIEKNG